MSREKNQRETPKSAKRKSGRPKGSVSLGIPQTSFKDALEYTKMAYEKYADKTITFDDMANAMNLQKGSLIRISGDLKSYGLIEKEDYGWKITRAGIDAILGDSPTAKHLFEKNSIFKDLSSAFWDKHVTVSIIMDYLRKKYRKGENVKLITERFLEDKNYINSMDGSPNGITLTSEHITQELEVHDQRELSKLQKLMKLHFALYPPEKEEIDKLVTELSAELKKDTDVSIKSLAEQMEDDKEKIDTLKSLLKTLEKVLSVKYPVLSSLDDMDANQQMTVHKTKRKQDFGAEMKGKERKD